MVAGTGPSNPEIEPAIVPGRTRRTKLGSATPSNGAGGTTSSPIKEIRHSGSGGRRVGATPNPQRLRLRSLWRRRHLRRTRLVGGVLDQRLHCDGHIPRCGLPELGHLPRCGLPELGDLRLSAVPELLSLVGGRGPKLVGLPSGRLAELSSLDRGDLSCLLRLSLRRVARFLHLTLS